MAEPMIGPQLAALAFGALLALATKIRILEPELSENFRPNPETQKGQNPLRALQREEDKCPCGRPEADRNFPSPKTIFSNKPL